MPNIAVTPEQLQSTAGQAGANYQDTESAIAASSGR
jgi:hypothetical protein